MKLIINNLSKTYPNGVVALRNVSLHIENGMYGLLGPNGAGKSSLMRTIASLQTADSGTILLDGIDILKNTQAMRQQLGYLPQEFGVYPKISAFDLLNHIALLKGIVHSAERKALVDNLLDKVNLYAQRKKEVFKFSGGMKQRFGIAQALIGSPNVMIVDEPTAGLDPAERNRFLALLGDIAENKIVILSTHIVQDVLELCSQMAIINQGVVSFEGSPNAALEHIQNNLYEKIITVNELEEAEKTYSILSKKMIARQPCVRAFSKTQLGNGFKQIEPNLEDAYFYFIHPSRTANASAV